MKRAKISNKDLRVLGFSHPEVLILLSREANRLLKRRVISKLDLLAAIREMIVKPDSGQWQNHSLFDLSKLVQSSVSTILLDPFNNQLGQKAFLSDQPKSYPIYGKEQIELGALAQMDRAMSLPISLAGALMPDAHEGYGLPIGGVLATQENYVIPYAVGVDIACRMCMSVYEVSPFSIEEKRNKLKGILGQHTIFGVGSKNKNHIDTSVFEKKEWNATEFIKQHRDLAFSQLGTSGAGNHFVEWGELKVLVNIPEVNLPEGDYIALLSHSGSRGFGNEVASYYSRVAMSKVQLPKEARHLAWLDLNSEEGHEYWIAMNLAGDYASANHHEIHKKIALDFGMKPLSTIENHHNFAWKEKLPNGKAVVIHRKGATPASKGAIGIIPGSMTNPGFIVRGKGNSESLNSASHGAGRSMSRSQALKLFTWKDVKNMLEKYQVELIGGDVDEIPLAYKNIETVMNLQADLVEVLAIFKPRIVRMADAARRR
jgi:tRNA-splicing ligase RtcB